jgi:hypothetical protein
MPGAHLDDGALVRRLDGELDRVEDYRVEAHLAACDECRAELDAIARLSRRVSDALPLVDFDPGVHPLTTPASARRPDLSLGRQRARTPSPWPGSPVWRAAAALAFVAGLALAIAPVRAWIAERLGFGAERPAAETVSPEDRPPSAPTGGGVRVAFVPTGERFTIRVSTPQAAGALHIVTASGDTATGEVLGPGDADLLVLPDGLGIRNVPSSTADYRVVVPRRLAAIEVRVGDRVAWAGSPDALAPGGTRIDLTLDDERPFQP